MLSRRQFLIASAAGTVALSMPHIARAAGRTLRLGSVSNEASPIGVGAGAFAKAVAEKSGGSLVIEVYNGSAIGKAGELVAGVKDSSIDMFALAADTMSDVPLAFKALVTPFLFENRDAARAAFAGELGKFGTASLDGSGITGLGWIENGIRHVTAMKPVRTPADIAGLKIRVPESPISVAAFKALGASPLPLPFAELVPKLKSGEVEAQENPISNIISAKLEGMQNHISLTGHTYSPALIAISADIAAELTPAEVDILREAAASASAASQAVSNEVDAKGLDTMRANGWTVVEDVDHKAFLAKADAVLAACAEIVGAENLAKVKQLVS